MPASTTVKADKPPEPSQKNTSSSKSLCCTIALVLMVLVGLFFIGAVVAGVVLWKTYGPTLIANLTQTAVSTITKQATDENVPYSTPFTRQSSPTPTPIGSVPTPIDRLSPDGKQQLFSASGQILPESNIRNVTRADLVGLTPWELKVARNEIYARHGRPFVHQDLACYFANTNWYQKDTSYTDSRLSSLEINNAAFILSYEKQTGSPIWNTDTGCR